MKVIPGRKTKWREEVIIFLQKFSRSLHFVSMTTGQSCLDKSGTGELAGELGAHSAAPNWSVGWPPRPRPAGRHFFISNFFHSLSTLHSQGRHWSTTTRVSLCLPRAPISLPCLFTAAVSSMQAASRANLLTTCKAATMSRATKMESKSHPLFPGAFLVASGGQIYLVCEAPVKSSHALLLFPR